MSAPEEHSVLVIVGARLSGLRAAVELEKAGVSYVILEAMNHVGGRMLSTSSFLPTEDSMVELAAAWINDSKQSEMYALSQEFGFKLLNQRAEGTSLDQYEEGNVKSHLYEQPSPVSIPILPPCHFHMRSRTSTVNLLCLIYSLRKSKSSSFYAL